MENRLLELGYRRQLIEEIKAQENIDRMEESLRDTEVYGGKIRPYVEQELFSMYGDSYTDYPIKSSINVSKKVTDSRATLYRDTPTRDFHELSDDQLEAVEANYEAMKIDQKMMASNRLFELQKQTHVYCIPDKRGSLKLRALANHQVNVVPSSLDPEVGEIYILSSFNKDDSSLRERDNDGINQEIGDLDDFTGVDDRFVVWSRSYHFVMNGRGDILSIDKEGNALIENPISPLMPFIEVCGEKDFEYWTRRTSESSNFTVEYNTSLSSQAQIVNMQGFAQAFLKAPEDLMPSNINVGPAYLLKLITNPNMEGDVEFGFANSGADLSGVQEQVVSQLSQFLSTQGLDANAISASNTGSQNFSSGTERLLAMIEKFEASKDTMSLYENTEKSLYNLVVAWMNALRDTELLDDDKKTSEITDSSMSIVFNRPESVMTEMEQLEVLERKKDLGIISIVDIVSEIENKTKEEAVARLEEIKSDNEKYETEEPISFNMPTMKGNEVETIEE